MLRLICELIYEVIELGKRDILLKIHFWIYRGELQVNLHMLGYIQCPPQIIWSNLSSIL